MSSEIPFYIVNVFAKTAWSGNPLAIVPDADHLDTATMQKIARQFNLSETVFICSTPDHAAQLRIFAPLYELAFAGHPTIGAAFWLHTHRHLDPPFVLKTANSSPEITFNCDQYGFTLTHYETRPCEIPRQTLAQMIGVTEPDLGEQPMWISLGGWQLMIPLNSAQAVHHAQPNLSYLSEFGVDEQNLYIWHEADHQVTSRYFYQEACTCVEDPGTGSAAACLGAWAHHHGLTPIDWQITQAQAIDRPNYLHLSVDTQGVIYVGAQVVDVAHGYITIPPISKAS